MTGDRGLSTPIDAVLGLLLVGIAAGVVTMGSPAPPPEPPEEVQPAILGSMTTVSYETGEGQWTVRETVGGHVADAALAGDVRSPHEDAYREAVQARITSLVDEHGFHVQVIGFCRGADHADPVVAGKTPPLDRPVRATAYDLGQYSRNGTDCKPEVVLRRWSP